MDNPLLALQVQPANIDVAGSIGRGQELRTQRLGNLLQAYQLKKAQEQDEQANALSGFYRQHGPGIASGNQDDINALAAIDPTAAMGFKSKGLEQQKATGEIAKSEVETQKAHLEIAKSRADMLASTAASILDAPPAARPLLYQRAIQAAKEQGMDVSGAPPQYDELAVKGMMGQALTVKDRIEQHQKDLTAAEIARHDKASESADFARNSEAARHNKVEESISQNPFGLGGTGQPVTNNGDDFLKSLPPGVANQVKAIGDYRMAPPAGRTSPTGIKFMSLVNQYNPSYDATQYGIKTKARNDFSTGKNGNTVRSLNVAVQHLDQLGQLATALDNGDVQAFNRVGQAVAQQTGSAAPTNFDAAKQIVADEVVKAVVGSGGGVGDREEASKAISRANSPKQLAGVIQTYQGLLGGQLKGLKQQYEKNTGLDDFESFLAPETRAKLEGANPAGGNSKTKSGATVSQWPGAH